MVEWLLFIAVTPISHSSVVRFGLVRGVGDCPSVFGTDSLGNPGIMLIGLAFFSGAIESGSRYAEKVCCSQGGTRWFNYDGA